MARTGRRWGLAALLSAGGLAWVTLRGERGVAPVAGETRGAALFRRNCASCHGPAGRGDGRSAAGLSPPPRDFAAAGWRFERTRESVRRVVADGIPGTAMPSHRSAISDEEIGLLADHVLELVGAAPPSVRTESAEEKLLREAGFVDLRGTDVPPLALVDAAGGEVRLRDLNGQPVLVYCFDLHSPAARTELPTLARTAEEGRVRVVQVARDTEDADSAQRAVAAVARGLTICVECAGVGLSKFETRPSPAAWFLDSAGRPVGRSNGPRDWSSAGVPACLGRWTTPAFSPP